jgi:hypothetical protein
MYECMYACNYAFLFYAYRQLAEEPLSSLAYLA